MLTLVAGAIDRGDATLAATPTLASNIIASIERIDRMLVTRSREEADRQLYPGMPSLGSVRVGSAASSRGRVTPKASLHDAQFSVFHPSVLRSGVAAQVPVYLHLPNARRVVERDAALRIGPVRETYQVQHGRASHQIAYGAAVTVVPEITGCRFTPAQATVKWSDAWQRIDFSLTAAPTEPGFAIGRPLTGAVSFFVGPVMVAQIEIWTSVTVTEVTRTAPLSSTTTSLYQSVFVSYSHRDEAIVEALEQAYVVLGLAYLRDVHVLRAGQRWSEALLMMIDRADVFQLLWSRAASESPNVEREWRHALACERDGFIRPMYWERPMAPPPKELADLHFAFWTPGTAAET